MMLDAVNLGALRGIADELDSLADRNEVSSGFAGMDVARDARSIGVALAGLVDILEHPTRLCEPSDRDNNRLFAAIQAADRLCSRLSNGGTVDLANSSGLRSAARIIREQARPMTDGGLEEPSGDDDPYLTHNDLADRFNLTPEAARKRLDRWRGKNKDGGWLEAMNRKGNEPQYLYRLSAVRDVFKSTNASDLRPPQNNPGQNRQ